MLKEEMTADNVGRAARVYLNDAFDDARCTFRAWSSDYTEVFVSLDSQYGKNWKQGDVLRVPAGSVRLEKTEGGGQKSEVRKLGEH